VAKKSFEKLKAELDEACELLRQFTLGKRGSTQQDGVATIQRVSDLCDRLKEGFASGPNAQQATSSVVAAKGKIEAARARLKILKGKD
jgi:hypothetical protein